MNLSIGDHHFVYGVVVAVVFTGGERFYWFQRDGVISVIPASAVP